MVRGERGGNGRARRAAHRRLSPAPPAQCLQFKTDKDADVKRITRLVKWFNEHVASFEGRAAASSAGSA